MSLTERPSSNKQAAHTGSDSAPMRGSTLFSIILMNLIPLAGVLFFQWNIANVVILYWLENLVLGFWNIPRILLAGHGSEDDPPFAGKLFLCGFFSVHYGIFCFVHGMFIIAILGLSSGADSSLINSFTSPKILLPGVIYGTIAIFITTGVNLYFDYIANKDYRNWTPSKAMFSPYGHIIIIHIAIIASAFLAIVTGQPLWLLILIIAGKTALELGTHKLKGKLRKKT